jgi:hypothetical protein
MMQQSSHKKPVPINRDSLVESLRDISDNVGKSVVNDVVSRIPQDALAAIFGSMPKTRGELNPNEAIEMPQERQPESPFRRPEYVSHKPARVEETGLIEQIKAVRQELAVLTASMKSLNTEIVKAIAEQPVEPGVYHLNFFERLKSMIRMIRENIEDSRTWLATWSTCKKKKNYWGMYKKHGTSFGLSNERTLATSAG